MTEIHVRYTPRSILACIFLEFSFIMTYFVIPLRYTETINGFIVCLIDRKRYEHELEKQMESCVE